MRAAVASQGGAVGSLDRHAEKPGTDYICLAMAAHRCSRAPGVSSIVEFASDSQLSEFRALIQASCLGTGTIPGHLSSLLSSAADRAAASLTLAITSF